MSQQAIDYVRSLTRAQITPKEKSILRVIADKHNSTRGSANFAFTELAEETLTDERNLRRYLQGMGGLLEYTPGRGPGNFSSFRFKALDFSAKEGTCTPEKEGSKEGSKEGNFTPAIRKDLSQDLNQNLNPPYPPSSGDVLFDLPQMQKLLTVRQVRELRNRIGEDIKQGTPFLVAIERACQLMLFPRDLAVALFEAAGSIETARDLRVLITEADRKPAGRVAS
jgi:hypothetical protein